MSRCSFIVLAIALCMVCTNAISAEERQRLRVELSKNTADLEKLNKEASKLISFVEKSKSVPVAKNQKAPETSNGNPYGFMAQAGRGEEDKHTMYYGTFGGSYGPVSSLVNGGLPGMSTGVDPRGFGGPSGAAFPQPTTVWGAPVPGVSARGFTYTAPNLPINSLYPVSGLPYPTSQGPYYHNIAHPNGRNFTQFGPHPFGPYGVNGFATKSVIPKHLPFGLNHIGMTLGGVGFGAHPSVIPTTYPAQQHSIPTLATRPQLAGFQPVYPSAYYPTHGLLQNGFTGQYPNYGGPGFIPVIHSPFNLGFPGNTGNQNVNLQASWLPGVSAQYRPGMEFHHAMNLPGGNMQTWKTPSLKFGMGQGYPHPDFDRYSSVSSGVAPPSGK